jgi:anti-sigma regulatory factor (Ser/Thr protein kinase)
VCAVTPPARLAIPMTPHAPRQAREFVREAHCTAHNASVLDETALLVSELVTNAVRHGAPPITAEVECVGRQGMQVRVSDGSPEAPTARRAAPDAESGRGFALVDLLSDAWGVEPTPVGKAVWFRVKG